MRIPLRFLRLGLLGLLCPVFSASAQTYGVTIDWDPVLVSTDGALLTSLAGYRLFESTNTLLGQTTAQAMADPLVEKFLAPASTTTMSLSGLLPGATYQFRLTAVDATAAQSAFNIEGGSLLDVEISTYFALPDYQPPTVAVTAPITGAFHSGVVTLTAVASDDTAVASVQFRIDGVDQGPALTGAPYTMPWTASGLQGLRAVTAVATDASGNQATSAAVLITVSRTSVMLTLSPTVSGSANLAVASTDPTFPSGAAINAAVSLPSGVKNVTLSKVTTSVPTYSATIAGVSFTAADYNALEGTAQTVVVGAQTFNAAGAGSTVIPTVGGRINDPGGSAARVIVPANGVSLEAQILLQPLDPDVDGARARAADGQHLLPLGSGMDFVFHSSGVLNSATVTLPFNAALISSIYSIQRVKVAYFNSNTNVWEVVSSATLGNGIVSANVTHFSAYVPVLVMFDPTASLRDAYAYPNPAANGQAPTIRVMVGIVDSVEVAIFDAAGRKVNSGTVRGQPTGVFNGEYYYDYRWTDQKASGVYFAVIHAHASDGSTVKGRVKLAVVR